MKALAVLVATTTLTCAANATVLFDNFTGAGAPNYTEETRGATYTFGTVLNSLAETSIEQIELRWRPNNDMTVFLGIWDSAIAGQRGSLDWTPVGNNLLYSQSIDVIGDPNGPLSYLTFANVDFTFGANRRYDIGIWGSEGSLIGSWDISNGCNGVNTVMGGFESINNNANIAGGGSDRGYACVDPHIRLLGGTQTQVSAPGTLALLGLGGLALAHASRRRRGA
ncbi:MAG: hypothetical protein AAGA68_18905 [Pseudomonadota bacterium]